MRVENKNLILDTADVVLLVKYNENKTIMLEEITETISKLFNLKSFKSILIPINIHYPKLEKKYNSLGELVETFHKYGNDVHLFPYFGFDEKYIKLNEVNSIIKEYITNNLSISLNTNHDNFENSITIDLKISLDNEVIASESDYFSYRTNNN